MAGRKLMVERMRKYLVAVPLENLYLMLFGGTSNLAMCAYTPELQHRISDGQVYGDLDQTLR